MTLFRVAGSSLKFNIVDVSTEELAELTSLIVEHGGEVTDDEECVIKFTKRGNTLRTYPRAQIYDVTYIRHCIQTSQLVDLEIYRLGQKKSTDHCSIAHFLRGYCKCWKRHRQVLPAKSNDSTVKREERSPVSRSTTGQTEYHTAETSSIPDNSDSTDSDIEAILQFIEQSPVSPSKIHQSVNESQPVLTHNEMDMYASSLAGGDAAEFVNDIDEKRPCNLEFQTEVKPKLALLAEQQRALMEKRASMQEAINRQQRSPRTITRSAAKRALYSEDSINQEATNISTYTLSDSGESSHTPSQMQTDIKKESVDFISRSPSNDPNQSKKKTNFLRVIPEAREQFGEQTRTRTRTMKLQSPLTISENELTHQTTRNRRKSPNENNSSANDEEPDQPSLLPNLVHRFKRQAALDAQLKSKIQMKEKTEKSIPWINTEHLNAPRKGKRISGPQRVLSKDDVNTPKRRRQIVHQDTWNINNETEKRLKTVTSQKTSNDTTDKSKRTGALNKMLTRQNDIRCKIIDSSEGVVSDSSDTDDISEDAGRCRTNNTRSKDHRSFDQPGPSGIRNGVKKATVTKNSLKEDSTPEIVEETSDSDFDSDESFGSYRSKPKITKSEYNRKWRSNLNQNKKRPHSSLRLPFTTAERNTIIKYLVRNKAVASSKGLLVWRQMIEDGYLTHRTPQSILNHYKKSILPNIEMLGLDPKTLSLFECLKSWGKRKAPMKVENTQPVQYQEDESREESSVMLLT